MPSPSTLPSPNFHMFTNLEAPYISSLIHLSNILYLSIKRSCTSFVKFVSMLILPLEMELFHILFSSCMLLVCRNTTEYPCLDNKTYSLAKVNYHFQRYFVDDSKFSIWTYMSSSYKERFIYFFPKFILFILALLHQLGSPITILIDVWRPYILALFSVLEGEY